MNNEGQRRAAFLTPTLSKTKTEKERSLGYQMLRKQKIRKRREKRRKFKKKELQKIKAEFFCTPKHLIVFIIILII
jgi:hypothetical protein